MKSEALVELAEDHSRLTWEALADVDASRAIEHEAVVAWSDSLSTEVSPSLSVHFVL